MLERAKEKNSLIHTAICTTVKSEKVMEYTLIYSDRKTISISVKDGKITVRAPKGTSKSIIESFITKNKKWVETHIEKEKARIDKFEALSNDDIKKIKKDAKGYLSQRTAYYANIMGLKYGRITITSAKTRFGSCSSKGNISYSYRLMLYPELARDYVVVHELAHLVEMNHSKRFYSIIEKYMPDYKLRKRMLK